MAASNFTNLYNSGSWGYMGIGPMPAKSFTLTLKADSDHPIFTLGACDYTHIVAYNPNNTSQYAVYSGTSFTVYNNGGSFELVTIYGGGVEVPDEQTITIDYDPSKWDFHGLESLEGAALCIATNEYGSAPDGSDYASISTERKTMFWYEVNVIVMVDKINSYDIYAKRAERDAAGNDLSTTYATKSELPEGVPAVTSSDDSKVLTASYSGGQGSYSWQTAQGGGASYTAGDGIDITANEVSVNTGTGLSFESAVTSTNLSAPPAQTGGSTNGHSLLGQLNADVVAALKAGTVTVKPLFAFTLNIANGGVHFAICQKTNYNQPDRSGNWLIASDAVSSETSGTYTMTVGDSYTADFSTLDAKSNITWSAVEANPTGYYLQLISYDTRYSLSDLTNYASINIGPTVPTEDVVTCEVADASAPKTLAVSDPIPSHNSTDANKVLTVNSSGNAVWAAAQGATYTAGNMIAINQNAIGVSTSAGITDIQQVNSLPASPVSTVLYLIPEA